MSIKDKNLWPYGILGVILLGVVLIIVSVRIAVKNPIFDDKPFFIGHNDMDSSINEILQTTKEFEGYFNFYLQANAIPTEDEVLKPYSPYFRPPHRDKNQNNSSDTIFVKLLNTLYVLVEPINGDINDLEIMVFMQKIGSDVKQEIFILNPKENSFISSKPTPNNPTQIPVGKMVLSKQNVFVSPSFELAAEGRWIVSLQINYKNKNVILEKEFFGIEKL